ncbi:hypothetical protein K456DRAFT_936581 [Colletotrichum gloeosporioides 23]|nr:hypothetical protein K456DRAFT_936581 [Colletotrichum gloeosporioides 23]
MSDYQRHYFGPYYAWRVSGLVNSLSEETARLCQNILWADHQLLNQHHKSWDFIHILGKLKMPVRGQLKDLHVKYLKTQKWFLKDQQSKKIRSERGRKSKGRKQNRVVKNHLDDDSRFDDDQENIVNCSNPFDASEEFHSILRRMDSGRTESTDCSKIFLPSENFIGTVLGGQFQLGRLVRSEEFAPEHFADVYEVTPLLLATDKPMEALAYDMRQPLKATKRSINHHAPFVSCRIDQSGKKYLVYRVFDRQKHETERRKVKKKKRLEKQRKGDCRHPSDPVGVLSEAILETEANDSTFSASKDQYNNLDEGPKTQKLASSTRKQNLKGCDADSRNIVWKTPSTAPDACDISTNRGHGVEKKSHAGISKPKASESFRKHFLKSCVSKPGNPSRFQTSRKLQDAICYSLDKIDEMIVKVISPPNSSAEKERATVQSGLHGSKASKKYLKHLKVASMTLNYRSQLCFHIRHEFRVVSAFVNFIAEELANIGENFDLEWQMKKGWVPQRSKVKRSSFNHLMKLPSLLQRPVLRENLRQVAETLDLDEAIRLRSFFARMLSNVSQGNLDQWLWDRKVTDMNNSRRRNLRKTPKFSHSRPELFWGIPLRVGN